MKRVIVTGATGFVGRNLIKKLLDLDFYIYAIIRPKSSNRSKLDDTKNMTIIELDLNEIDRLPDYIGTDCDAFYHLAWEGIRGEDRDNYTLQYNNYVNSLKTVEVAKRLKCKEFVTTGSQAEYGACDTKINEDTECSPTTEYGKRKYQFFKEATSLLSDDDTSFKEARIFSLYGPGDHGSVMINSVLDKMIKNDSIDLTEGVHSWNFLHIDDAVDGLIELIKTSCPNGPYNLSGDETWELKQFIEIMRKVTKSKSIINYGAILYPKSGMIGINPDNKKLKDKTGWSPKIDFKHGIKDMADSCQERKRE